MTLTIDLPKWMIEDIDDLANETELSRSEVIKMFLEYVLDDEDIINQVFPEKDEEYEDEDEEEEE